MSDVDGFCPGYLQLGQSRLETRTHLKSSALRGSTMPETRPEDGGGKPKRIWRVYPDGRVIVDQVEAWSPPVPRQKTSSYRFTLWSRGGFALLSVAACGPAFVLIALGGVLMGHPAFRPLGTNVVTCNAAALDDCFKQLRRPSTERPVSDPSAASSRFGFAGGLLGRVLMGLGLIIFTVALYAVLALSGIYGSTRYSCASCGRKFGLFERVPDIGEPCYGCGRVFQDIKVRTWHPWYGPWG